MILILDGVTEEGLTVINVNSAVCLLIGLIIGIKCFQLFAGASL